MKIAIFTESYTPYISGVSRSVELLEKELKLLGHKPYIICPKYKTAIKKEENIISLPSIPTKYPGYRIAMPLPLFLPKIEFDIVHTHSPFGMGLLAKHFATKQKIPLVYSLHTLFTEYLHYAPIPKFLSQPILVRYMQKFAKNCNKVIVPNQTTLDYAVENKIISEFEIIPTGVDFDAVNNANGDEIRAKLNLPENAKILLFVGRLSKEKNIRFLLNMFKIVKGKAPNTFLCLAAKGPEESSLKSDVENLNLKNNVLFLGQIPYPDILNYYKMADIFVFSSKTETQGIVIAEAKACGLPVVAINAKGVKESVIDGVDGFLTDEDIALFSEKVLSLCNDDKKRAIMGKNAEEDAMKRFSSKNIAKKFEWVYNSLVKGIKK